MKRFEFCEVVSNNEMAKGIFDLRIRTDIVAGPGQFVNVFLGAGEHILPRPVSVCETEPDGAAGVVRLVFRVAGKGTRVISRLKAGERVRIMGPLGVGFDLGAFGAGESGFAAVIGGGIGIPPLLGLVKSLRQRYPALELHAFLGFRNETMFVKEFERYCRVHIATDDGSVGFWGSAIDDLRNSCIKINTAAACGPAPMLKAAAQWAQEANTRLFVAVEERMACGVGACVGCAVKAVLSDECLEFGEKAGAGFTYKKVCVHGPVFDATGVVWE